MTILFADLVGSTSLGEQLDPEEVHDLVGTAQAALARTVEQYEGHVAKYLGDGLMVLFGAPIAHEDDAERAVLAGLEMQDALAEVSSQQPPNLPPLQLRVGITSGEVIAGAIAGTYDVIGDAANTAARLQGAAEVGGVLVGEETMRLAQRRIRFGERQVLHLKGKAEPVSAYPALGLRERLSERWETRQRSPLIDRETELGLIRGAWEQAQQGRGQLLTLVAEAGVGKSRLVAEAVERIARANEGQVLRARCLSYGQQISLWLIADLVRTLCSLRERDERERVSSQVQTTVDALLAAQDEGTRAAAVDVLGELVGLPAAASPVAAASAQIRRQVLIRSLRLGIAAFCSHRPVVLVLEDLHWIDAASGEVLAEILSDVPALRLLVLATKRLEWVAPWREWDWPRSLPLAPLDERQAAQLAGAVLGGIPLAPELERYVAERAGGNPFFVEELLRSLQEAGDLVQQNGSIHLAEGAAERLPSTLTEVLLARLDRLERQVRRVAQVASVIGRSFALQLLAQVAERDPSSLESSLSVLQRAEIAFPRRSTSSEYVFKHATVRDVAYNTLLLRRRQALHAATARAIARLYPPDEYVETIAYHYARTQEHQEAGAWLERAGDRAARIYANEVALDHYAAARSHLEQGGAEAAVLARLDEKEGTILATMGRYEDALCKLEQAATTYRQVGDTEAEGNVVARIGWTHRERAAPDEGIARIETFLAAHQEADRRSPSLAHLYTELAFLYLASGRYQEQLATAERATAVATARGDNRLVARAEMARGIATLHLGRGREGLQIMEEAIPLAEAVGDLETLESGLIGVGVVYLLGGALDRAKGSLERAVDVAERMANPARIEYALTFLGHCLFCLGHWQEAEERLERAVEMGHSRGSSWFSASALLYLGNLLLARGEWKQAADYLQEAIALAERSQDLTVLPTAQGLLAELRLAQGWPPPVDRLEHLAGQTGLGITTLLPYLARVYLEMHDVGRAEATVERGVQTATVQHQHLALLEGFRVQGMVRSRQGRWEEAERSFQDAVALARSMPHPYAEARTLYERGIMEAQRRKPEEARRLLEEALAIFQRLGAQPYIQRTEQALVDYVSG